MSRRDNVQRLADLDESDSLLDENGSARCCPAGPVDGAEQSEPRLGHATRPRYRKNGWSSWWRNRSGLWCFRRRELLPRILWLGGDHGQMLRYPANIICNQKYSLLTFLPVVLYNQFKFFLNMFFLIMACSQFVPALRIGEIYTYWGPLIFVLTVTLFREAVDELRRVQRDRAVNGSRYSKLTSSGAHISVASSDITVGDLIYVPKGARVPADMVLVRTTDPSGTCYIRTDQLDGETDWKLRLPMSLTQRPLTLGQADVDDSDLVGPGSRYAKTSIYVEKPQKDIYSFIGKVSTMLDDGTCDGSTDDGAEALNVENTLWANSVIASGTALGMVIYTGPECRASMNTSSPRSKVGLLDVELNRLTKLLFAATMSLSVLMICLKGFDGPWYFYMFRFLLLFSYIIPISLRVNLDLAKMFYCYLMQRDSEIAGAVARSRTIPEELGRVAYLLTDKTGTLTKNQMVFKRLHVGHMSYSADAFDDIRAAVSHHFQHGEPDGQDVIFSGSAGDREAVDAVLALALCHNVTPVSATEHNSSTFQASSPDEIALVSWCQHVGLSLVDRSQTHIVLQPRLLTQSDVDPKLEFTILHLFPFSSDSKRMGIVVRDNKTGVITLYMKGADSVMSNMVVYTDWLGEAVENLAREGLRTLVVASKTLSQYDYEDFRQRYSSAQVALVNRAAKVAAAVESLEVDLRLLCVTGVEDKLQDSVRNTLETLRNAGLKIWMLTGDKLETAECIAKSSRLVSTSQSIHIFGQVQGRSEAHQELNAYRRRQDAALVISGSSLSVCLEYYEHEFMDMAVAAPAVVCCRCTPEQKAAVVSLIQEHTGSIAAAVGDGGNDVSMIQAACVGIGLVGVEGLQASLASDFSITKFSHLARLLLVHGRYSYQRSAALSQFVIHRGLIITTMQVIFSAIFYFASVSLYQGLLMVGYATVYTMFPVFSLVLDRDVTDRIAMTFPELYKELAKGRALSTKTFFIWMLISLYQGGVIMFGALLLFEDEFIHIVSISFTALILTELTMVALTVRTWHYYIALAEMLSLAIYVGSLALLRQFFDTEFIWTLSFVWKTSVITAVSCVPLYIIKLLRKQIAPSAYQKLS